MEKTRTVKRPEPEWMCCLRKWIRMTGLCMLSGILLILAFFLLYEVKSLLGIDFFPDKHLSDLLQF